MRILGEVSIRRCYGIAADPCARKGEQRPERKLLRDTGLATPQPPTQAQRDAMVLRAVIKLMKDDCGGHSGSAETPDGVILDGIKVCRTFTQDA